MALIFELAPDAELAAFEAPPPPPPPSSMMLVTPRRAAGVVDPSDTIIEEVVFRLDEVPRPLSNGGSSEPAPWGVVLELVVVPPSFARALPILRRVVLFVCLSGVELNKSLLVVMILF